MKRFALLIIGEENAGLFKKLTDSRNPMGQALVWRKRFPKCLKGPLGSDSGAEGTRFVRSIVAVDPSSWINEVSSHEAAFLMAFEKEDFKSSRFALPEKNDGCCLFWYENHVVTISGY
jgi:hypothetical protein